MKINDVKNACSGKPASGAAGPTWTAVTDSLIVADEEPAGAAEDQVTWRVRDDADATLDVGDLANSYPADGYMPVMYGVDLLDGIALNPR